MRWTWPLIAVLVGCGGSGGEQPAAAEPESTVEPAPESEATTAVGSEDAPATEVDLTFYWVAVRPAGDPDEVSILDCDGRLLTRASNEFRAEVSMERTARARLDSGELITFNDVGGCYRRIDSKKYPWGIGVDSLALQPFRSIAVDPKHFTIGRWYYAKQLDGVMMPAPAPQRHDGCVRAVDEGSAIRGRHVDFFVGDKRAYGALAGISSITLQESARCAAKR